MSAEKPTAIMDAAEAMANDWNVEHSSNPRQASSFIAHAWIAQICAESVVAEGMWSDEMRRRANTARRIAGEYADDIVVQCVEQQPMYHSISLNEKHVVCVQAMLGGCVPLWVHYYHEIVRFESIIAGGE